MLNDISQFSRKDQKQATNLMQVCLTIGTMTC